MTCTPFSRLVHFILALDYRLPRLGAGGLIGDLFRSSDVGNNGVALNRVKETTADGLGDVEELFMEQRLDHFDRQESRTFSQRYFVNKE